MRYISLRSKIVSLLLFVSGTCFTWFACKTSSGRTRTISYELSPDREIDHDAPTCPAINWTNPRYCRFSFEQKSRNEIGNSFGLSAENLLAHNIPLQDFVSLSESSMMKFVFVTAASSGYFHIVMDAIGSVQKHFPNREIYFYDLDESPSENQTKKIKLLCNVKYRKFNYTDYPQHFRELHSYTFKPVIVHEMLREFEGVFWIDSSVRFLSNNLSSVFSQVYSNNGILTFARSHHSNFAATHPQMYRYLPISAAMAGGTEQRDANSILFFRTRTVYTRIVVWWVLCALQEDCMASGRGLLACSFKGQFVWAGCHRFDQSAINILLATHFQYDDQRYLSQETVLVVQRGSSHQELIETCPDKKKIKTAHYLA